jgi:hypothetical protein
MQFEIVCYSPCSRCIEVTGLQQQHPTLYHSNTSQTTSDMINNLRRNQVNYSTAVTIWNLILSSPSISIKTLFICNEIARRIISEMLWIKTTNVINLLKTTSTALQLGSTTFLVHVQLTCVAREGRFECNTKCSGSLFSSRGRMRPVKNFHPARGIKITCLRF